MPIWRNWWPRLLMTICAGAKFSLKATAFAIAVTVILLAVFHDELIDSIYKNVDDLNDGEMPANVVSYPSSPDVVAIVGGSGEGLNCSLPLGLDAFFDGNPDQHGVRHLVRQRFRQACVFHDLCYRHGLATYGYSQNDCDRILQNQAFRLCQYIKNKTSDRCQSDAKKILAGVSLGGFDSYRGWDRSTYFEFDPEPTRSRGFSTSRVVDHPFKSVDPVKYHNESDQVILSFANTRSSVTVDCATCKDEKILEWSNDSKNISVEFKSVGLSTRPEALVGREVILSSTSPIWLPPRRHHAAPHLVSDASGKHHLVWTSRSKLDTTSSCIIFSDAAKLLTYTLPKRDVCRFGSGSQLSMVEAEMFASSPVPMALSNADARDNIVAVGLTPQRDRDRSLRLCLWSERIRAQKENTGNDKAECSRLGDERISAGTGLGAFQNFPIVRSGQQIYFVRDVGRPLAANWLTRLWENIEGNRYSESGSMMVLDVAPPSTKEDGPGVVKIGKIIPFSIEDRYDPMMPITRSKNDLRFLSLLKSKERLQFHLTDFSEATHTPQEVGTINGKEKLFLHSSWAERPMMILEANGSSQKIKFLLSRGTIAVSTNVDKVNLETLLLESDAAAPISSFTFVGGKSCKIIYSLGKVDSDRACARGFERDRPMRSSPAALMKASQLLVGRFAGPGLGLAFVDSCMPQNPLIVAPIISKPDEQSPPIQPVDSGTLRREVICSALEPSSYLSQPMQ